MNNLLSDYGLDELEELEDESASEHETKKVRLEQPSRHSGSPRQASPSEDNNNNKHKLPSFSELESDDWSRPEYLKSQFETKSTTSKDYFKEEEKQAELEKERAKEKWALPPQPTKEDKEQEKYRSPLPVSSEVTDGLKKGPITKEEAVRASKRMTKTLPQTFQQKEKRKRNVGQQSRGKSYVEEEKRILRQSFKQ